MDKILKLKRCSAKELEIKGIRASMFTSGN